MADLWTCRTRTNSTSCPLPLRLASAPFRPLPAVRSSLFPQLVRLDPTLGGSPGSRRACRHAPLHCYRWQARTTIAVPARPGGRQIAEKRHPEFNDQQVWAFQIGQEFRQELSDCSRSAFPSAPSIARSISKSSAHAWSIGVPVDRAPFGSTSAFHGIDVFWGATVAFRAGGSWGTK